MVVAIASELLFGILSEAAARPEEEVCGLLFGTPSCIVAARPAANVAPDRRRHFELDPAVLLQAHRAERNGGPRVIGHYHSHPSGDPAPSARDAADAAADGMVWLIVAGQAARLWRAVERGAVHQRFDPVALQSSPCTGRPPSPQGRTDCKEAP